MTNSRLFSFSKTKRILGSTIPILSFLFFFLCTAPNISAQSCALTCNNANVSLDQNCQAEVLLGVILSDSSQCVGHDFALQLYYDSTTTIPVPTSPFVGVSERNLTLYAVVTASSGGVEINRCWSTVRVDDYNEAIIECADDTVSCYDLSDYIAQGPTVSHSCVPSNQIVVDTIGLADSIVCDDVFLRQTQITWQASDGSGNVIGSCVQTVWIERIDPSLIAFPIDRIEANNNELVCDVDYDLDNDGVLDWELLGFPTYNGDTLAPGNYPECKLIVDFTDSDPVGPINCITKIERTWSIYEWRCPNDTVMQMVQVLHILDTTGPVITCPGDMTMTTNAGECDGQIFLPPATAVDDCSAIIRYDMSVPSTGYFETNQNGGLITLPVGTHRVIYTAVDECLNKDTCSIYVTMLDATPPIPICDQHTVVSLTNNGRARVPAHVFDDGSYDECGIDFFRVRRMTPACGYDDLFRDYVEFSCCDLGTPVMVVFRVYDLAGNYNDCMVEVVVQDKLAPVIFCPPNITVSCTFPYDMDNLDVFGKVVALDSFGQLNDPLLDPRDDIIIDDPGRIPYSGATNWGLDGYALGSCNVDITQSANAYLDQCGNGFIARVFTVTNSSGVSRSCTQTVSIHDYTPFDGNSIVWPANVDIDGCGANVDPSATGRPTFTGDDCEMIGVSEPEDWVFNFDDPNNPACFKILRLWKVIDWCSYDALTGAGLWTHTQVIKVTDPEAPEITGCDDVSICSFDPDCVNAHIDISISANDDCTPFSELGFSYVVDLDNNDVFDFGESNNPFADFDNDKNEASGTYPIGTHRILWTVSDGCGNFTTCEALFEVRNCTKPVAYCYNGLAAELAPIDRDMDGNFDWAELELWASDFDAGSYHPCYDDVVVSFSADTSDKFIMFNCDSLGRRYVELWATAPNGEQSFCISFVDIQDNNQVCPPGSGNDSLSGNITGLVTTEMGEEMNETMIMLVGGGVDDMTNQSGQYAFLNMPFGGSYQVDPEREDHYLNGVTANDLSIIQRHIAGIEDLNSAYKHFAADANNDDAIDIRDVLALRKLLLGIDSELPNHDSWMFLDATCTFGPGNPLEQACSEVYDIPDFTQDMVVDFIGVKIGDVDEDAQVNLNGGDTRSNRTISLVATDITLQEGMRYQVPVRVADEAALRAIQLTYSLDPGSAILHDIRGEGMADAAFNTDFAQRGLASQVWASMDEVVFDGATVVLDFTATTDGLLSEILTLGSQITETVGFDNEGDMDVELTFETELIASEVQTFELFQNRPNPFSHATTIGFVIPEATQVSLTITDVSGRQIHRVVNEFEAGINEITIDKSQLNATGIMYYRLDTGKNSATKKMILLN